MGGSCRQRTCGRLEHRCLAPRRGEPKRAIAAHALENLSTSDTSDTGISTPRRKLREQIERVRDGLDR